MCRSIIGINVSTLELKKQVVDEELLISVWINISADFEYNRSFHSLCIVVDNRH